MFLHCQTQVLYEVLVFPLMGRLLVPLVRQKGCMLRLMVHLTTLHAFMVQSLFNCRQLSGLDQVLVFPLMGRLLVPLVNHKGCMFRLMVHLTLLHAFMVQSLLNCRQLSGLYQVLVFPHMGRPLVPLLETTIKQPGLVRQSPLPLSLTTLDKSSVEFMQHDTGKVSLAQVVVVLQLRRVNSVRGCPSSLLIMGHSRLLMLGVVIGSQARTYTKIGNKLNT